MLNIHYGREDLNKDKYIFDNIKGRTLLLVPDQFTLQAERNAFFYMGKKGFMDLEVLSISRLGTRVLRETGGSAFPLINKYGRHMLLTKILEEMVIIDNPKGKDINHVVYFLNYALFLDNSNICAHLEKYENDLHKCLQSGDSKYIMMI